MTRPVVAAFLLLLCWSATVSADSGEAAAALQRALGAIDRAAEAPESDRSTVLAPAVAELSAHPSLGSARWLVEPLEARPPDLARGRARLAAALEALGTSSGALDSAPARRVLADILNSPPFVTRDLKDSVPAWMVGVLALLDWALSHIANVVRWPFDRLRELLFWFRNGPAYLPFVTLLAMFGLVSLALLYRRGLRAVLASTAAVPDPLLELPPTSAEAAIRAQRLAAAGQFREACHFLFISALLWIEEHGHARFDRAATNREHLARLEPDARLSGLFRPLVDRFDRLWYGQVEAGAGDYRDLEVLVTRVKQRVA